MNRFLVSLRRVPLLFLAASLLLSKGSAATKVWVASPTDSNWATAANWTGGVPVAGTVDVLSFNTSSITSLNNNISGLTENLLFNSGASAFTFTGSSFNFSTGNIINNSSNDQTFANTGGVGIVAGGQSLATNATGGRLIFSTGLVNNNSGSATINLIPGSSGTAGTVVTAGVDLSSTSGAKTLSFGGAGNLEITGLIQASGSGAAASGLTWGSTGTLTIDSAASSGYAGATYTGATTSSAGGNIILDFTNMAAPTNLINSASALAMNGGGTLTVKGSATGATSQTFGNFTVGGGTATSLVLNSNGGTSTTLTLGNTWTRGTNGTLNIDLSSTAGGTMAVSSNPSSLASNNVLGFATVKDASGTGLAFLSGGNIVRLTGQAALPVSGSSASVDYLVALTGTSTTGSPYQTQSGGNFSVNSLTIDTTGATGANFLDLGTGTMTLTSKGLLLTGGSDFTIQDGQVGAAGVETIFHIMGAGKLTVSGTVGSGNASVTKDGSGTLLLSGANAYTGTTTVASGTLQAGSATAFGTNSAVTLGNVSGAVLDLNGNNVAVGSLNGGGTLGGTVSLGSRTLTVGAASGTTTYSGLITGTGGLVKVGASTQNIAGLGNNFSGGVTIDAGTLGIGNSGGGATSTYLGTGAVTLGDGVSATAATFSMTAGTTTLGNNIVVAAGTGVTTVSSNVVSSQYTITATSGNNGINGTVTLNHDLLIANASNGGMTFNGAIGSGNLATTTNLYIQAGGTSSSVVLSAADFNGFISNTSTATGATTLNGILGSHITGVTQSSSTSRMIMKAANLFAGGTDLKLGTLELDNSLALQNSVLTMDGGTLAFGSTATAVTAATTGGLAGSGALALTNSSTTPAAVALTVGNGNASATYGGVLSGAGSLVKTGTGAQTLTAASTYTGATTVSAGSLIVNGSIASSSAVNVNGGTLGGSGSVGVVVLANGAFVAPGTAGVAATLSGTSLAWNAGGALNFDLGGTSDLLALSGALTKSGSGVFAFNFTDIGVVGGTVYDLINFGSTTFSATDFSATGVAGTFSIVNGNELAFTAATVPEPGTWALLLGGGTALFAFGKRRRAALLR